METSARSTSGKLFFELTQDEDDWPPYSTESVWVEEVEDGLLELKNIPFFATNVSLSDQVRFKAIDGARWFAGVVVASGNSTLRVFSFNAKKTAELTAWLKQHNCEWEYGFEKEYLTINIPKKLDGKKVMNKLRELEKIEEFEFEVSCRRHEDLLV